MSESHWSVFVLIVKIHIYIQSTVMRRVKKWGTQHKKKVKGIGMSGNRQHSN